MLRLEPKHASQLYGTIQAAITSAVATGIASYQLVGLEVDFFVNWAGSWLISWLMMLPVVILVSPVIQRAVLALTNRS